MKPTFQASPPQIHATLVTAETEYLLSFSANNVTTIMVTQVLKAGMKDFLG